jgi:hypothetical protein
MTITTTIERITPAQAKDILKANNIVNRKLRERVHQAYRKDMEQGRWQMTGEAIQFDTEGHLLNGQHRLTALSNANVEHIEFLIVRGLPTNTQLLMDQGSARSIADAIRFESGDKAKYWTICAAISRWLTLAPVPDAEFAGKLKSKCSTAAALETYRTHTDQIIRAAEKSMFVRNSQFPVSVSSVGYCYFHFAQLDVQAADRYFYSWTDLAFDKEGDPRKAGYKRISMLLADDTMRHGPLLTHATVSVMTRSWNSWRRGEKEDTIPVKRNGAIIPPERPI